MGVNKKTEKKANPIISRNVTEMSKIASHRMKRTILGLADTNFFILLAIQILPYSDVLSRKSLMPNLYIRIVECDN